MTLSNVEPEELTAPDLESAEADGSAAGSAWGRLQRVRRWPAVTAARIEGWSRRRKSLVLIPLTVWLIALIAAATVMGVRIHHNDAMDSARGNALSAADTAVPELLSYRADSAQQDLGAAANLLTGDFKNRFQSLVKDTIIPAAREHQTETKTTVAGKSVIDATANSATLLMFIDQTTSSKESPQPRLDVSRVRIRMDRIGDQWLISELQPV